MVRRAARSADVLHAGAAPRAALLPAACGRGFFTNGGKRVYVTRIEAAGSRRSVFDLHDRGTGASAAAWLLRPAAELSGVGAADALYVTNVNAVLPGSGGLIDGDHIRVGGGSDAEYQDVNPAAGVGVAAAGNHLTLTFPLARAHASVLPPAPLTNNVHEIVRVLAALPNTFPLAAAAQAGATTIDVTAAAGNLVIDDLVEIDTGLNPVQRVAEYRFVQGVAPSPPPLAGALRLTLDSPLHNAHTNVPGTNVTKLLSSPGGANEIANATFEGTRDGAPGDRVAFLDGAGANFVDREHLVIFDRGNNLTREARRIGRLSVLSATSGAYDNYPAGALVSVVAAAAAAVVPNPKLLTGATSDGANVIALNNRVGIAVGTVLQIGAAPASEFATVTGIPDPSPLSAPPNAGNVVLSHPLRRPFANGSAVTVLAAPTVDVARPQSMLVLPVRSGATAWLIGDGGNALPAPADQILNGEVVRVTVPGGAVYYHALGAAAGFADARPVRVMQPLSSPHAAGAPIAERTALVRIQALDTGSWGNRLRVSIQDEDPGLVATTPVVSALAPNRIRLGSAAGVERGTVLELRDGAGVLATTVKVLAVERATAEATLDAAVLLTPAQVAAINLVPSTFTARSREFRITVRLLAQPDPLDSRQRRRDPRQHGLPPPLDGPAAQPLRADRDRRHRRPAAAVRPPARRRELVRPRPATCTPTAAIRLGPETLVDVLPDGRSRARRATRWRRRRLDGDAQRHRLHRRRQRGAREPHRALHAAQHRGDQHRRRARAGRRRAMQNALIDHCELMRYRFAVLDAHRPPRDTIADVQPAPAVRHQIRRALPPVAADPRSVPGQPGAARRLPDPAVAATWSASTRAPTSSAACTRRRPTRSCAASSGCSACSTRSEHDILNPYPVNINVIRDFRAEQPRHPRLRRPRDHQRLRTGSTSTSGGC